MPMGCPIGIVFRFGFRGVRYETRAPNLLAVRHSQESDAEQRNEQDDCQFHETPLIEVEVYELK